ncbi:sulfite exporter TauE/SafE family protein [Striga asiatica]|uniref:Sulfite exporter TauE/SafE family protein n=1 Tax=Striga asiatica TaxID=4170 RepID=A0A5A7RI20_STRAF|nr:sulfite exporter TauE/SafE family protein [Striga asiatica]
MSFLTFITGSTRSWQPALTVDTTNASYWLNWRVLLCSIWILMSMVFASLLISKHEYRQSSNENQQEEEPAGVLYEDEVWRPCLKSINPVWLLGYRVFAFVVLSLMLILNVVVDGGAIFYFYTQYSTVALMHIPCYGIFLLIMKAKHFLLSKWFPQSYRFVQ